MVCYSAGFRELGTEGAALEQALVEAAGDLALVGPNVFGMLNYVQGAHLWPYSHGGQSVTRGPAIISQSGMLSGYLLTNRRSVNFSYVIGAGNQSVLGVEDYLEALLDRPEVTAFGIYLESFATFRSLSKQLFRPWIETYRWWSSRSDARTLRHGPHSHTPGLCPETTPSTRPCSTGWA
ncbi:MAG: hypothetical protein CM1200mP20_09190 [Pseudomonadota bacterium]|nr:MAG: hypothetical protein CM1200mP20_09190 [Pseudomonadota bacterium]